MTSCGAFWSGFRKGYTQGALAGCIFIVLWIVVSQAVFAFRNPHLTDTERFLRFAQALRFEKVQP